VSGNEEGSQEMNTNPKPESTVSLVGVAIGQPWVDGAARVAIHRCADDALELAEQIQGIKVVDNVTAAKITELLTLAVTRQREVEQTRRSITDPLKHRAKEIEDAVRPLVDALDALVKVGKSKVISWQRAERERVELERRGAELERRERELAGEPTTEPPPVTEAPRGIRTDYGTASVRKVWDFEVVDVALVPAAFLMVNEQAIRGAVRGGARSIPGVRIFQSDGLAVRAR